jgi:predicted ATP-grasp superfamily ATP-dependent carboligase
MNNQGKKEECPPAVIVGLNDASLGIVRSLGEQGVRLIGLYDEKTPDHFVRSKYCASRMQKSLNGSALVKALTGDVARSLGEPAVLFCATDESVLTVAKYEEELKKSFRFVMPSYDAASRLIGKRRFDQFAAKHSFDVPETFLARDPEDIERIADEVTFPCVVKPELKSKEWWGKVYAKAFFCESKKDFMDSIDKYQIQDQNLIVQEWIEGDDTDMVFCLAYIDRKDETVAMCTGRKLRTYPARIGTVSVAEAIWLPEIAAESMRLFRAGRVRGFCSVEFKRSSEDGRLYIIEPTIGRPDFQEGIFKCWGIDLPYIAYLDALERDFECTAPYRNGVKWINEQLEFYAFQEYMNNGSKLRDFFSIYKGEKHYSLWSARDPMPAISFMKEKMAKGIRRWQRRLDK